MQNDAFSAMQNRDAKTQNLDLQIQNSRKAKAIKITQRTKMNAKRVSAKSISRVFKVFGAVSLVGLLGMASLHADEAQSTKDMQAEIDALEKENQLLELKQKNEKLKAGQSSKDNAKAESKNAVVDKSGAFGFCKGQHASTGCFIGGSVGLAFGENWIPPFSTVNGSDNIGSQEKSFTAFPVNIDLGWQWYYAQNAGFRFKGYVGYSYYGTKFDELATISNGTLTFDTSIHALQYGLEASYLYDFIYKGDHNFGAHLSVGFEGTSFVGQSVDITDSSRTRGTTFPSYSKFTWTSGIGIHYFYKVHHQFFLSYLYRGYTNDKTAANESNGVNEAGGVRANLFEISTTPSSTIMLSYAYKF
ncbi:MULTISPECIES: outer membrane beta-barrel protein [unclassified Helicobacter]|nr:MULTISPECIES: outer membrane beta-barrel protein [unclassified Helicobacter]